jgi:hypothetical protein
MPSVYNDDLAGVRPTIKQMMELINDEEFKRQLFLDHMTLMISALYTGDDMQSLIDDTDEESIEAWEDILTITYDEVEEAYDKPRKRRTRQSRKPTTHLRVVS